jgi:hypothetical protein
MNRDKRPGDRRSLAPGRPGGAVWPILGLLFLLHSHRRGLAPAGPPISYSEFKQAVRSGQVAEVFVGDQAIADVSARPTAGAPSTPASKIRSSLKISTPRT